MAAKNISTDDDCVFLLLLSDFESSFVVFWSDTSFELDCDDNLV